MHTRSRERRAAEALLQLHASNASHASQSVVMASLVQGPSGHSGHTPQNPVLASLVQGPEGQPAVHASQNPSAPSVHPSILNRALSHYHTALSRARALFPSTQPGDTILMNFFVDVNHYATVQYMKNEEGIARIHRMEGPYADIHMQWTHEVTDFPFR